METKIGKAFKCNYIPTDDEMKQIELEYSNNYGSNVSVIFYHTNDENKIEPLTDFEMILFNEIYNLRNNA